MEQKKFDIKDVKVLRTKEGTAFEIIVAILLIVAWAVAFRFSWTTPYDFLGIHIHTIMLSLVAILLIVMAYHPQYINFQIGKEKGYSNIRQVEIAVRATRIMGVEMALLVLVLNSLIVMMVEHTEIVAVIFVVVFILTALFFSVLIYRSK